MESLNHRNLYSNAFNTLFFEFLDDVLAIYPECQEIRVARNACSHFRSLSGSNLVKMWHTSVYLPYRHQIMQGNVDFFLYKEYTSDLKHPSNSVMEKIEHVRACILTMSESNKKHVAKYILNLSRLSEMYSNS